MSIEKRPPTSLEAAVTYDQFKEALKIVNKYQSQLEEHYKCVQNETIGISIFSKNNPETLIIDAQCSLRLYNSLLTYDFEELGVKISRTSKMKDLTGMSISEFSKFSGVGKKTIEELKELCFYSGVELSS